MSDEKISSHHSLLYKEVRVFEFYTLAIASVSLFLILRYKVNTIYLFLIAAGSGLLLSLVPSRLRGSGLA